MKSESSESTDSSSGDIQRQQKLRFAAVIEQLGVIYGKEIDEVLLRAYWAALRDVSIDDLENAAYSHIALEKWFPKPCELRHVDATAVSYRAWDTAITAAERVGAYKSVDFEDGAINATIRFMGGWRQFCGMKPEDEHWRRQEFLQAYRQFSAHGISSNQSRALVGIAQNSTCIAIASHPVDAKRLEKRITDNTAQTRKALKDEGIEVQAIKTV